MLRGWARRCGQALLIGALAAPAAGGGSGETTLVVANADSPLSLAIAHHYMNLREISADHLVRLHGLSSLGTADIGDFRQRIWTPIQHWLRQRDLEDSVDLIAYSGDLPYRYDFTADLRAWGQGVDRYYGRLASLNGLSYLAQRVMARDRGYLNLNANQYFQPPQGRPQAAPRQLSAAERDLVRRANARFHAGDHAAAAALYAEFTEGFPWSPSGWYRLALCRAAQGQRLATLVALERAVARGYDQALSLRNEPLLQEWLGQPAFQALLARMQRPQRFAPAQALRSRDLWFRGQPLPGAPAEGLNRYWPSILLAYTGRRGNTRAEVFSYLERSAAADASRPQGRVYLLANRDVRSEVREPYFQGLIEELAELGGTALRIEAGRDGEDGILPRGRDDVIGAVIGHHSYDWTDSGSRLLPGGIAEALTSFGADFGRPQQTKLSHNLAQGAAGSSGAVTEPYAFHEKFPLPVLHRYYAEGLSLVEAYYRSVSGPYQLLIVGDPLARPYARFSRPRLLGDATRRPLRGSVDLAVDVGAQDPPPATIELWLDGRRVGLGLAGHRIPLQTTAHPDGRHQLRLVAVEDSPIATRSVFSTPVRIDNHGLRIDPDPVPVTRLDQTLVVEGRAPGLQRVGLWQGNEALDLGEVVADRFRFEVAAQRLGFGRVWLRIEGEDGEGRRASSGAWPVEIGLPAALPALFETDFTPVQAWVSGADGQRTRLTPPRLSAELPRLRRALGGIEEILLQGHLRLPVDGYYQLVIQARGAMRLRIDHGALVQQRALTGPGDHHVPLHMRAGVHHLQLHLQPEPGSDARILLNGDWVGSGPGDFPS